MATDVHLADQSSNHRPLAPIVPSFLLPVESPKGLVMRLMYWYSRRQWGKVPRPFSVFCARMPSAFGSFFGKVSKLDKKLELSQDTAVLIRARVASTNMCMWCVDGQRWFAMHKAPQHLPKLDALHEYQTSPLFSAQERAALDFITELTEHKHVSPEIFAQLSYHYSEREICEIVWLISSEHLYNLNNLGLGIGSDGLCQISNKTTSAA
ncbi:MAG: carboxymuconolactone decarboxylase family protein [Solirubrobacteraceae bacterium]